MPPSPAPNPALDPGDWPPVAPNPFRMLLGFRLTRFEDGLAAIEMPLEEKHLNHGGTPHGGVYASLLDSALGATGCFEAIGRPLRPAVTLNLNVSFLARPRGRLLLAEGRRVGGGRTTYFAEGAIHDETGLCLARGTGTFRLLGTGAAPPQQS